MDKSKCTAYEKAFEASFDAMVIHQNGKIMFVNPAAVTLIGAKDKAEMLGACVLDYLHPNDKDMATARLTEVVREKKNHCPCRRAISQDRWALYIC